VAARSAGTALTMFSRVLLLSSSLPPLPTPLLSLTFDLTALSADRAHRDSHGWKDVQESAVRSYGTGPGVLGRRGAAPWSSKGQISGPKVWVRTVDVSGPPRRQPRITPTNGAAARRDAGRHRSRPSACFVNRQADKPRRRSTPGPDYAGSDEYIKNISGESWFRVRHLGRTLGMMVQVGKIGRCSARGGADAHPQGLDGPADVAQVGARAQGAAAASSGSRRTASSRPRSAMRRSSPPAGSNLTALLEILMNLNGRRPPIDLHVCRSPSRPPTAPGSRSTTAFHAH